MIEMCTGCGRPILVHKIANLTVKCEPTPLTDVGDIVKLLTSPNPPSLWMVERNQQGQPVRLRGARRGERGPVPEHRCTRVSGSQGPPSVLGGPDAPKGRETGVQGVAAPSTPSSAPWTARSSAPSAVSHRSEGPRCDRCSKPCADGTYASIALGELTVWAQHVREDVCTPA